MVNEVDYVELGLACADLCQALVRGIKGRETDQSSQPVLKAIGQLTTWVELVVHVLNNLLTKLPITGR